jgi:hypothetical protein
MEDRPLKPVVRLSTIESFFHVLPNLKAIDIVEGIERPYDVVIFPQSFLRPVPPEMRTELPDNYALGSRFQP